MTSVEKTGRTVDEAIAEAVKELGVKREDVEIEVLEEGSKGFLGILGVRQARVRVSVNLSIETKVERAVAFLEKLVQHMGIEATIEHEIAAEGLVHIRLSGRRMGVLIGRRGQTLDAIQYLTNIVANDGKGRRARIVLDAEGYRQKRAETLRSLALRLADKVKRDGRKAALEPMSALERRVVHLALRERSDVETRSEGDEPYRRVIIVPKR